MKKNKVWILLIGFIVVVLTVSWIIGFGVKYFPNLQTYGTAGEWLVFWGSVAGGLMSTLVAGGVAYYISKTESEKSLDRERQIVKETVLINIKLDHLKELKNNFDEMKIISDEVGILFFNLNKKFRVTYSGSKETIINTVSKKEKTEQISKLRELYLLFFREHGKISSKMKNLKVLQNNTCLKEYIFKTQKTNDLIQDFLLRIGNEESIIGFKLIEQINFSIRDIDDAYDNLLGEYYTEFYSLDINSFK